MAFPPSESSPAVPARSRKGECDVRLLELLVCPLTGGPLEYDMERSELRSHKAGLAYPVRGGVPVMLPSEARRLGDEGQAPSAQ